MNKDEMLDAVTEVLDTMTRDRRYADKFALPIVEELLKRKRIEGEKMVEMESVKIGRKHPGTSHSAARGVLALTGKQRKQVYDYFVLCGAYGATDDEIHESLGLPRNSVRPRRVELGEEPLELIVRAGYTRKNRLGNDCDVWVLSEFYDRSLDTRVDLLEEDGEIGA